MQIQKITNLQRQKSSSAKNDTAQNLTGFGVQNTNEPNSEQLISKDSAEAIKNKFLSNISFAGHTENLSIVTDEGPYKIEYRIYYGTSGQFSASSTPKEGYKPHKIYEREPITYAKVDSGPTVSRRYANEAAVDAIRASAAYKYGLGERIEKRSPVYDTHSGTTQKEVYFTDPGETVYYDDIEDKDYVVYARGAHNYRKKSFWEKIFD